MSALSCRHDEGDTIHRLGCVARAIAGTFDACGNCKRAFLKEDILPWRTHTDMMKRDTAYRLGRMSHGQLPGLIVLKHIEACINFVQCPYLYLGLHLSSFPD